MLSSSLGVYPESSSTASLVVDNSTIGGWDPASSEPPERDIPSRHREIMESDGGLFTSNARVYISAGGPYCCAIA